MSTMISYFLHVPYKTLSKKETKLKFEPLITKSISKSIKKKMYSIEYL